MSFDKVAFTKQFFDRGSRPGDAGYNELLRALTELTAENRKLREVLALEHDALDEMGEWHGASHADECPGDDTCDCTHRPFNDRVNAAFAAGEAALADKGESDGM